MKMIVMIFPIKIFGVFVGSMPP